MSERRGQQRRRRATNLPEGGRKIEGRSLPPLPSSVWPCGKGEKREEGIDEEEKFLTLHRSLGVGGGLGHLASLLSLSPLPPISSPSSPSPPAPPYGGLVPHPTDGGLVGLLGSPGE